MNNRKLLVSLAVGLTVATTLTGQAQAMKAQPATGMGAWSVHCGDTAITDAQIDPIVAHGVGTMSMHYHTFFGARGVTSNTTAANLVVRPTLSTNTCTQTPDIGYGDLIDNASYWSPLLMDGVCTMSGSVQTCPTGDRIAPSYSLNYYRQDPIPNADDVIELPAGLEMMAGSPMNTGTDADPAHIDFSCVASGKYEPTYAHIPHLTGEVCPNWGNPTFLRMRVQFPNCLTHGFVGPTSGSNMNWNDGTHMAYSNPTTNTCPTGMDPIPQVQVGVRWKLTGSSFPLTSSGVCTGSDGHGQTYSNCYIMSTANLSSDQQPTGMGTTGANGATAHADFMNGWTSTDLHNLMIHCYWSTSHTPPGDGHGPTNCGAI